jgi:hypothetical protein
MAVLAHDLYFKAFGVIPTAFNVDKVCEMLIQYGEAATLHALKETADHGVRNLAYALKVLEGQGKPSGKEIDTAELDKLADEMENRYDEFGKPRVKPKPQPKPKPGKGAARGDNTWLSHHEQVKEADNETG